MNRVGPIPHEGTATPAESRCTPRTTQLRPAADQNETTGGDQVELSAAARGAHAALDAERIGDIRTRIADGAYLTPEKIEAAIEGLYRDALRER